ncbi:MAG TPA: pyridoxal-dependent decarboxylase [Candidatus Acidoferrales bacterium]|nr:pyridoxal-dependent decarboxylase [Candidatus Acidoferrales bacterium]
MGFDFSSEQRRKLGYRVIDRIDQYFSSLKDRPVQQQSDERVFEDLRDALPEIGEDAAKVLDEISTELIDRGFHVPSANYFGLMNPTPTYMAVLAEALVAALNPQLASLARSQMASRIEAETVRWVAERIGWSKSPAIPAKGKRVCDGTFTSGGNEANFTALALALSSRFPSVVEDGVASIGARPVLYASSEAHHSLDKSVGLLGLGRKALRRIPVNEELQLDRVQLEHRIEEDLAAGFRPLAIVATAGTTNSGAIDNLNLIAEIAARHDIWLHVDAAYGGALIFSDNHRKLLAGIERADSITIDPHKWLAMPFSAGVVLTSHPELLEHTFAVMPPYMPRVSATRTLDNFKLSAQWSRRMNSLKFWLTLRVHGRRAYEQMIDRQFQLSEQIAEWIENSGTYELTAPHKLPILNFRVKGCATEAETDEVNRQILEAATEDGRTWFSRTQVNGKNVLRLMVISYLSDEHNVAVLTRALAKAAHKIAASTVTSMTRASGVRSGLRNLI